MWTLFIIVFSYHNVTLIFEWKYWGHDLRADVMVSPPAQLQKGINKLFIACECL